MSNQYKTIRTPADAETFQDKANGLHDGYITHVGYHNGGISARENYLSFDFRETSLVIQILVTSMRGHPTFELHFRGVTEWQIRDCQMSEMTDCTILFLDDGKLLWADDCSANLSDLKKGSYVIAESIQYRKI